MRGLRSRLDRVWRMLMTGLCFVLFGLGGLTLSLVWFNLLLISSATALNVAAWHAALFLPVFACSSRWYAVQGYWITVSTTWTFCAPSGAVW